MIIKKIQFQFVESKHFIIYDIKNIIHSPKNEDNKWKNDIYSKLIGKRFNETMENKLTHFFINLKKNKLICLNHKYI